MLLHIPGVLDRHQVNTVVHTLSRAKFVDGRLSAGAAAERVKHNEELDRAAEQRDYLAQLVMRGLYASEGFRSGVLPHRVSTPIFARYTAGMSYGDHIDDPIMGAGQRYRSDVSFTVFFSDPDGYEGGELVIRTSFGERKVKFAAGDAVAYPSSSLHRVAEVRDGERLVAVGWAQSLVRDAAQRELLYELSLARERLLRASPEAEETAWVDHAYVNLVRMWAEV
jgi:PKHD-type hydroxylase